MTQEKTERANCHFVIKQNLDGKPQIIVERYHQTISVLNNTVLGFDLLGGPTLEQAKKAVAFLNENVLNVFVTRKQNGTINLLMCGLNACHGNGKGVDRTTP
jgi:hypothetical protein